MGCTILKNQNNNSIRSFAPGRVCLFGEHQDYLGLPVIAAAIDLGIYFKWNGYHEPEDGRININMPDINSIRQIDISSKKPLEYTSKRDYLLSSINVLFNKGINVNRGFDCEIHGTLPISAGASSSSALVVSWLQLLHHVFSSKHGNDRETLNNLEPEALARWANQAEVGEFGESGGFMDHVTSAVGGVLYITPDYNITRLGFKDETCLVLGDSLEKKETVENIRKLRARVETELLEIKEIIPEFSIDDAKFLNRSFLESNSGSGLHLEDNFPLVYANLQDGLITKRALTIFQNKSYQAKEIGALVTKHHVYLRDYLGISTPKIEKLIKTSLNAGAAGAKINGSGFGGTMFAVCENKEIQNRVAQEIDAAGGKAHPVNVNTGAKI